MRQGGGYEVDGHGWLEIRVYYGSLDLEMGDTKWVHFLEGGTANWGGNGVTKYGRKQVVYRDVATD